MSSSRTSARGPKAIVHRRPAEPAQGLELQFPSLGAVVSRLQGLHLLSKGRVLCCGFICLCGMQGHLLCHTRVRRGAPSVGKEGSFSHSREFQEPRLERIGDTNHGKEHRKHAAVRIGHRPHRRPRRTRKTPRGHTRRNVRANTGLRSPSRPHEATRSPSRCSRPYEAQAGHTKPHEAQAGHTKPKPQSTPRISIGSLTVSRREHLGSK